LSTMALKKVTTKPLHWHLPVNTCLDSANRRPKSRDARDIHAAIDLVGNVGKLLLNQQSGVNESPDKIIR
jgi:hypothetical protein